MYKALQRWLSRTAKYRIAARKDARLQLYLCSKLVSSPSLATTHRSFTFYVASRSLHSSVFICGSFSLATKVGALTVRNGGHFASGLRFKDRRHGDVYVLRCRTSLVVL